MPSIWLLMMSAAAVLLLHHQTMVFEAATSGYLMDPISRSSVWRLPDAPPGTRVNNNDMSIDCGSGGGLKVLTIQNSFIERF